MNFETIKSKAGINTPSIDENDIYERGLKIVPECISPDEGEIHVKQYKIAVLRNLLRGERAEGRLQVTNKRVVLRATGKSISGKTTLQQEFSISEIGGVESRKNYKYNVFYCILAILIFISSTGLFSGILSTSRMLAANMGNHTPEYVKNARNNEQKAIEARKQAENNETNAPKMLEQAKTKEKNSVSARERAQRNLDEAQKSLNSAQQNLNNNVAEWNKARLTQTRDNAQNQRNSRQKDLETAQTNESEAKKELTRAEQNVKEASELTKKAKDAEIKASKTRVSKENTAKTVMCLFGILIGLASAIIFSYMYNKYGLKKYVINIALIILTLFGFSISSFAVSGTTFFLVIAAMPAAIFMLIYFFKLIVFCVKYCFRPNLVLAIMNKSGMGNVVDVRRNPVINLFSVFNMDTERGIGFSEVIPTPESEIVIRELWAIISDIQKLGDFGIEKWIEK
jgi:hypothetical protein